MKNNIEYYRHDVNSHRNSKFKMLRLKYGWEGEGKFWALNNLIAQSENCWLDLNKKFEKASVAEELNFTIEEFDSYISFLEKDCELIDVENNRITTEDVQYVLEKVSKKRMVNQSAYRRKKEDSQNSENEIQQSENIQSKVKESKVKESKDSGEKISPTPAEETEKFFSNKEIQKATAEYLARNSSISLEDAMEEINKFINYWVERTKSGKKERWQIEKTFEVKRRLTTWMSNRDKFQQKKSNLKYSPTIKCT